MRRARRGQKLVITFLLHVVVIVVDVMLCNCSFDFSLSHPLSKLAFLGLETFFWSFFLSILLILVDFG